MEEAYEGEGAEEPDGYCFFRQGLFPSGFLEGCADRLYSVLIFNTYIPEFDICRNPQILKGERYIHT